MSDRKPSPSARIGLDKPTARNKSPLGKLFDAAFDAFGGRSGEQASLKIAVIGWGSLIWDLDDLAPKVQGEWRLGAGPALPIEFSRISQKRQGALTAAIDPKAGEACPTAVIESRRGTVREAAEDLAARERTPLGSIGWVDMVSDDATSRFPSVNAILSIWCHAAGWDGAVWTDLQPNFEAVRREAFTTDTALAYLQSLDRAALEEAIRYIDSAPAATDTPLRRFLAADPWWISARAELSGS